MRPDVDLVEVVRDEPLELICSSDCHPDCTYRWYFYPEGRIYDPVNVTALTTGDTLYIERMTAGHSGQYMCKATKEVGEAKISTHVEVVCKW